MSSMKRLESEQGLLEVTCGYRQTAKWGNQTQNRMDILESILRRQGYGGWDKCIDRSRIPQLGAYCRKRQRNPEDPESLGTTIDRICTILGRRLILYPIHYNAGRVWSNWSVWRWNVAQCTSARRRTILSPFTLTALTLQNWTELASALHLRSVAEMRKGLNRRLY